MKIFGRLLFKWYFHKNLYVKALASLEKYPCNGDELWACYSLGMYDTVAKSLWNGRHLKGGFAFCVSLAAVGRLKEAESAAKKLEELHGFDKYRFKFASAIALYMPSLALKIADSPLAPRSLLAGLLVQAGEQERALQLLENIHGEAYLLKSNILNFSPKEQLNALSSFLVSRGLAKVLALDETKCVSVANIKCVALPKKSGKMPLVSVLMTSYNTSSYVKYSLESILAQTYKNLEIIVVDDNSTDETPKIIKEIAAEDKRVKFFANKINIGTYASKTLALKHAKGEFIACHDSDDFAHNEWIKRQIKPLLKNSALIAAVSQWIKIDECGRYCARSAYPLLKLHSTSLLFRKKIVLEKTGSWDIVRTGADSEFYARLKLVFGKEAIKYIKLPLIIGAYRKNSLTASVEDGYDSHARLKYWEAWTKWHIDCFKKGEKPVMTADKRPFPIPKEIAV
ncbi:MAG: glycosyltransferase [Campylobacteraceae bacterium]|nr:glycosyltransferase [Campylobacteraceae bacterium]